jgi:hypothetical protein
MGPAPLNHASPTVGLGCLRSLGLPANPLLSRTRSDSLPGTQIPWQGTPAGPHNPRKECPHQLVRPRFKRSRPDPSDVPATHF